MIVATTPHPSDRARAQKSMVLRALEVPGRQREIAEAMGVSEPTASRIQNGLEQAMEFLALAGFKVVPISNKCIDSETYAFLTRTHTRVMPRAPQLIWDTEV